MATNQPDFQEVVRHERNIDRLAEQNQRLNVAENHREVEAANQNSAIARVVNIVYYLFGIVELVLVIRVFLHLVAANSANAFANIIDGLSYPFVVLFATLVQNPVLGTTSVLEITTIIAMVVWAIVAWMVARLVWLVLSRPR
jgi:YggT family protein